jgi:A/G-specific adenine glycosylase
VREELGIEVEVLGKAAAIDHAYSHFRITLHLFHARWTEGVPSSRENPAGSPRWVLPSELTRYAFPAANKAVIRRLVLGEERAPESPGPA